MASPAVTDRDVERVLARLLATRVAAGVLLAAFFGPLYRALSLLVFGLWIGFALAGAILGVLALQHVRHASSRAAGLALAATVPVAAVGLWSTAAPLRAGGDALARWVLAIRRGVAVVDLGR
jgi:hypothetical protein